MAEDFSTATRLFCELATRIRNSPLEIPPVVPPATESTSSAVSTQRSAERNYRNVGRPVSVASAESCSSSSGTSPSISTTHSELQTLFPHHFTSTSRPPANCCRNRSNSRKRKRTGQQNGTTKTKSVIRKFVCLADKEQTTVPDREDQRELLVARLGEIKVSVPEDTNETGVRDLLINVFPKLKESGGFELMYVESRSKDLLVIPQGPDGLSMKYLASFIGQGKIYIRPIQQDLLLTEDVPAVPSQKEECRRCHAMVDLVCLRDHYTLCSKINDGR